MTFKIFNRIRTKKNKTTETQVADYEKRKKIETSEHKTFNSRIDLSIRKIESYGTSKKH